jgi:pimeloyl-ACP methyl ester carboxylesterase
VTHGFLEANGIRLHYVEEGTGPLLLLLHGFPDFWYSWRHQLPVLAAAGHRVVAVDLRGYNQSERPAGVAAYRLDEVTRDIAALVQALGGPAIVVGHDWGGVIAWHLAMHHPATVASLVVLNAPHPVPFRRELTSLSSQPLRSSYAAFFQLPTLPEAMLSAFDFALFRRTLRHGPAESERDVAEYMSAFRAPGALSAALNYYRAHVRFPRAPAKPIPHPTLLLWGVRDPFLVPALTEGLERWVPTLQTEKLKDAGHWLHHSHAPQVNARIRAFLHAMR